ncbi:MAG: hypothetical protein WCB19_07450 [Thermoplasmata archaeon]
MAENNIGMLWYLRHLQREIQELSEEIRRTPWWHLVRRGALRAEIEAQENFLHTVLIEETNREDMDAKLIITFRGKP